MYYAYEIAGGGLPMSLFNEAGDEAGTIQWKRGVQARCAGGVGGKKL